MATIDFRVRPPVRGFLETLMYSAAKRRDGFTRSVGFEPSSAAVDQSMSGLLADMDASRAPGCVVAEVRPAFDAELEHSFSVRWYAKLATAYAGLPAEHLALLEPKVRESIDEGTRLSAVAYARATLERDAAWGKRLQVHRDYDFLVCPTTAVAPFSIAVGPPRTIQGRNVNPLVAWFLIYPFNMAGNPAISVLCGRSGHRPGHRSADRRTSARRRSCAAGCTQLRARCSVAACSHLVRRNGRGTYAGSQQPPLARVRPADCAGPAAIAARGSRTT